MPLKLLAVGDLHLGRRPSRLPKSLAAEADSLSPAAAWRLLVDQAIDQDVDAVALAGDVVEREEDFYEAYRELRAGVARLAEAGIRVAGIAGNHDVQVLPRLADQLPGFELIGRGGRWETLPIAANGETVTLHGWSFPRQQVPFSPVEGHRFEHATGVNLGLLHCDRDVPGSPYAPVLSRELRAAELDGWLLGHIHAPDALTRESPGGYLGCVTGMDPGEPGNHGPWLFTIEDGRIAALQQWVLAPLRWETLTLDLTQLTAPEDVHARLLASVRARDAELAGLALPPRAVGLRIRLTGRTRFGNRVEQLLRQDMGAVIDDGAGGTRYFIEHCLAETRPEIALGELAQRPTPPGLLARRLCLLDIPETEAARQLIASARVRLENQRKDARWQPLDPGAIDDETVIDWLRRAGTRLLEDMLEQQAEPRP